MSYIRSKIDDINKLRFEPIPGGGAMKAMQVARVDNTIVVLGADGVVYTNHVSKGLSYSGEGHRLESVLMGCIKLKLLTASAVRQHQAIIQDRREKMECEYAANDILSGAEKLKLRLTNAQKGRLEKLATKNGGRT